VKKKVSQPSALNIIETAQYPIIFAPFHGVHTPVKLRELTHAQILSCGSFSLIETFQDKIKREQLKKKPTMREIYEYAELQHNIARASLVAPTYEEIFEVIGCDPKIDEKKKELKELRELLRKAQNGPERIKLEEEVATIEAFTNLLLPDDFLNFIFCYTLGIEKSDIKLLTEKMLLDAAIMAEKGHDNPADHITGIFTDFMKDDINKRAWILMQDERGKIKPNGR
jgi:hypothetical protein